MSKIKVFFRKNNGLLIAICLVLLSWAALIALCGENPVNTVGYIIQGVFSDSSKVASMINKVFLFFFTAMAFSIPGWTGMNNVGADGQLVFGGFCAALLPQFVSTGIPVVDVILSLIIAAIAGGLWAAWPAFLKVRYNINEIVTSLLSTYIIVYFTEYMVAYPLRIEGSAISRMEYVPDSFKIPNLGGSQLSWSVILVIIALIAVEFFRSKTIEGYRYRMTGENMTFAQQGGVNVNAVRFKSMTIGGMMAGLCGGLLALGLTYTYQAGFSADYGMLGMLVALIAGMQPMVILVISILFCTLQVGAVNMQIFTSIPSEITGVLQALMVFFIAARSSLNIGKGRVSK